MQTKIKHITLISAFLTLMSALCLSSCINDNELCPPDVEENSDGEGFTFTFTMATRNAKDGKTRALIDPGEDSTETGNAAENYLDLDNLTFLLFDNDRKLQRHFVPEVNVETDPAGPYVKYKVFAFINDRFIKDAVKEAEYSGNETDVTFSILVLANYAGLTPERFNFHPGQTMEEIFDMANVPTFAMPGSNNANGSWIPSIFSNTNYTDALGQTIALSAAHIPMAGLQTFTVNTAALRNSTAQDPLHISPANGSKDIYMLRALAKIEVVDASGVLSDQGRRRITAVELVGRTSRGSMVPTFAQWSRNGTETQYVQTPSIPDGCTYSGYSPETGSLAIPESQNGIITPFFADRAATELRNDGRIVFSCYLTEFNTNMLDLALWRPMWLRLKAQDYNADGSAASTYQYYRVDLADYNENSSVGNTLDILRNNIYRYEIKSINYDLDLILNVLNWETKTVEWSYDNVPGYNQGGLLNWTLNGNPLQNGMMNTATATITIPNNSDILVGTFAFAQPIGGRWTATLVQGNKDTAINAFIFVDENGKEIEPPLPDVNPATNPSVSGPITGEPSIIRIKAKNPPSDNDQVMRLIFTVTSLDGRTMSANLVEGSIYGDNKYFSIQQNAKL